MSKDNSPVKAQPSDEIVKRVARALFAQLYHNQRTDRWTPNVLENARAQTRIYASAAIAATGLVEESARLKALGDGLAELVASVEDILGPNATATLAAWENK